MSLLVVSVVVVLLISAFCSLSEAALYAVRVPYVRSLEESGNPAGRILARFKQNMEQPIAAILILNTVANTAGAAIAGAQAASFLQGPALVLFSIGFTAAVLVFSELIPKVVGVAYNKPIARGVALPWSWIVAGMTPIIWCVEHLTDLIKPQERVLSAPEEEVEQMARMSAEEGSIWNYEAELVRNVLQLDDVRARQIMTPRPVVLKLPDQMTLKEAFDKIKDWVYSRIPVYSSDDPEIWVGFVMSRDILAGVAHDKFDMRLAEIVKPLYFVSANLPGHVLLQSFLRRRTHLFGVMDDYGDLTGIVTLEDVLEALIGEEIVDEVDTVADMQEVARRRKREQFAGQGSPSERPAKLKIPRQDMPPAERSAEPKSKPPRAE
jgi:CBS domain containing-hemolysin-like protein